MEPEYVLSKGVSPTATGSTLVRILYVSFVSQTASNHVHPLRPAIIIEVVKFELVYQSFDFEAALTMESPNFAAGIVTYAVNGFRLAAIRACPRFHLKRSVGVLLNFLT